MKIHPTRVGVQRGITWLEVCVALATVALLGTCALPSRESPVDRGQAGAVLEAMNAHATRMQQHRRERGSFAERGECAVAPPQVEHFGFACRADVSGTGYWASATGTGPMAGYAYSIDHRGIRRTTAHPKGRPPADCWTVEGGSCAQ